MQKRNFHGHQNKKHGRISLSADIFSALENQMLALPFIHNFLKRLSTPLKKGSYISKHLKTVEKMSSLSDSVPTYHPFNSESINEKSNPSP